MLFSIKVIVSETVFLVARALASLFPSASSLACSFKADSRVLCVETTLDCLVFGSISRTVITPSSSTFVS